MKVVHILGGQGGIGGAERVVAAIVMGSSEDHEILAPFATPASLQALVGLVGDTPLRGLGASSLTQLPRLRREVIRHLRLTTPDVIHAHLFHGSVLVASLPRRLRPASVLTHHHGPVFRDQARKLEAVVDRWASGRFDRIVGVSRHVVRFLRDDYDYPDDRLELIPNGWSGEPRERSADGPDFLCVGRLRAEKGHHVLLRAFAEVRRRAPDVTLRLVGDGPLRAMLEDCVSSAGLTESVQFVGDDLDVWQHYATAGVLVVPSLSETQGIVVLEAAAAGCPVVAACVGGVPEIIEDGVTGRLVPPGDSAALASAMIELHRSPLLATALARRANRTADGWRMEQTVGRYDELYRQMIR